VLGARVDTSVRRKAAALEYPFSGYPRELLLHTGFLGQNFK
jgi:hypothetical protein